MVFSAVSTEAAERTVRLLHRSSYVVLGGYAVALLYRCGLFRAVLPKSASTFVERVVEKIKSKTEPLGNPHRFALARRHLIRVYSLAALGMLSGAAGSAAFFLCPTVPVVLSIFSAVVPGALLLSLPHNMMHPLARAACVVGSCFSFGYSFGPIFWVAWDSLAVFVMCFGSTMLGLCVPLFLTRGMISYVLSSQVLSCTLAIASVTTITLSAAEESVKGGSGLDVLRRADINVLLTLQLVSNLGINVLHTLPTIAHIVRWEGDTADLLASVDPIKESMCICAGGGYVLWRSLRWSCRRIIRSYTAQGARGTEDDMEEQWRRFSGNAYTMQNASNACASIVLVIWYVRAVSKIQRGETVATLEATRNICAKMSPISLLIGGVRVP